MMLWAMDYEPKGFCPQCGFRMDAGRCPECGKQVAPRELVLNWRAYGRKRTARRIALVLAVLILLSGGYCVSRSGRWCRLLPTRALLLFQGDEQSQAIIELFRQYEGGSMSAEYAARMFDQAMLPPRIDVLKSLPAGCDTAIRFYTYLRVPGGFRWANRYAGSSAENVGWSATDERSDLRIDGEPAPRPAGDGGDNTIWRLLDKEAWRCYEGHVPPLSPGKHTIAWTKTFALQQRSTESPGMPALLHQLHQWTLTASAMITVDSRPAEAHVQGTALPEQANEIKLRLQMPDYQPNVGVHVGTVPYESDFKTVAVAGEVWWRWSDSGPFKRYGELCLPRGYSLASSFSFPTTSTEGQPCVDIRITPSAKVAVRNGCSEYFGDVIEVLKVPVAVVEGEAPRAPQPVEVRLLRLADVVATPTTARATPENSP